MSALRSKDLLTTSAVTDLGRLFANPSFCLARTIHGTKYSSELYHDGKVHSYWFYNITRMPSEDEEYSSKQQTL